MTTTADIVARMKNSRDPEEIRALRAVLRKRIAVKLADPPPEPPAPVEPPADSLEEVRRHEREQWAAIPGPVGARVRNPLLYVVTPWRG